jgi:hypothetical protein
MPLTRSDVENTTQGDLQELCDNAVGEGILYDYKLELYGGSDADKREFLKDVSSFANTAGGHIVIGIKEDGGLPTAVIGVAADLDAEKLRLENLLRDRIEPRILGLRMVPVDLDSGRRVLVVRIPRSWNPPHAVLHNKSRLIFARNSAGAHEASVDEMRSMFIAGATAPAHGRHPFPATDRGQFRSMARAAEYCCISFHFQQSERRPSSSAAAINFNLTG